MSKVYDGSKPSTVSIWPEEVAPFGLSFSFWASVTEEIAAELGRLEQRFPSTGLAVDRNYVLGLRRLFRENPHARRWTRAGEPTTIGPDTPDLVEWTTEFKRRLRAHEYGYEHYAKALLDGRFERAIEAREEMIVLLSDEYAGIASKDLPDWYLRALLRFTAWKQEQGFTIDEIGGLLPFSPSTFARRRAVAKRRFASPQARAD